MDRRALGHQLGVGLSGRQTAASPSIVAKKAKSSGPAAAIPNVLHVQQFSSSVDGLPRKALPDHPGGCDHACRVQASPDHRERGRLHQWLLGWFFRSEVGRLTMHAIVLKVAGSMGGVVIPGLVAGVIYLLIALATGASAVASIIGGVVVAVIAVTVGLIIRGVYERRALGSHK